MDRCLECNRLTGTDGRRGLCRKCYKDKALRDNYPLKPRGPWRDTGKQWEGDNAVLEDLYLHGLSDRQIAEQLNRSVGSVCKARQRLGLRVSTARQSQHRRKR